MELELIQGIWGYHWWGNRKLFDEAGMHRTQTGGAGR